MIRQSQIFVSALLSIGVGITGCCRTEDSGEEVVVNLPPGVIARVAVATPDGRSLYVITEDSILVLDAISGGVRRTVQGEQYRELYRLAAIAYCGPTLSPDGRLLAIGEQTNRVYLRVFDVADFSVVGKELMCPEKLGWSADGKLLCKDWANNSWRVTDPVTTQVAPIVSSAAAHVRTITDSAAPGGTTTLQIRSAATETMVAEIRRPEREFGRCLMTWDGGFVVCIEYVRNEQQRVIIIKNPSRQPRAGSP